jgi:uroporphyrinogen-III decarboxylase
LIGEVKEPLVKNWKEVDKVRVPRERLSTDVRRANEFVRAADQFVLAPTTIRPFEQLQFIRGSQNLYLDLIDQPDELFILLEHIHSFYKEELELWASTDVDGLSFADDWGSQKSLLISPGLWRKIFRPLYKEYVEIAHRRGKFIFMHSDGHISEIFPDLVELRVDALNSQLFCMDIESLGNRFRGRITFWGEVDRQHILAEGKPEEVVAAVRRVKNALYRDGGVIAQCEFGAGARPENVALVFETWNKMI